MMMDDSLINDYVKLDCFNNIVKFIEKHDKTIHRVGLSCFRFYDRPVDGKLPIFEYKNINNLKLYKMENFSPWRINTSPSIWNRKFLIKMLAPNLTPWLFEKEGTIASRNKHTNILVVKDSILKFTESVRRHHPNTVFTDRIKDEDVKYLIDNKLIDKTLKIRKDTRYE